MLQNKVLSPNTVFAANGWYDFSQRTVADQLRSWGLASGQLMGLVTEQTHASNTPEVLLLGLQEARVVQDLSTQALLANIKLAAGGVRYGLQALVQAKLVPNSVLVSAKLDRAVGAAEQAAMRSVERLQRLGSTALALCENQPWVRDVAVDQTP